MAKKRRLRKTGYFNAPKVEEVKQEIKQEVKQEVKKVPKKEVVPPPAPEPEKEPEAPKKSLASWLKGSPKEE